MDVIIILLFALAVAFARAMIDNVAVTPDFWIMLLLDILIAMAAGYIIGRGIGLMLSTALMPNFKIASVLLIGYFIFTSASYVPNLIYDSFGLKIKFEPLLMTMVAGFTVTNFTYYRNQFEDLLHKISPWVYVAFFTLTGLGLKLDILVSTIGIAAILFVIRMLAIIIGTYLGGTIAGETPTFRRYAGLGLITQAGIALGLARETAVIFPNTIGNGFATLIISTIVLNEIFGPILLKTVLRKVGEAFVPDTLQGKPRRLLILGIEPQSIALRQMAMRGWQVVVADTDAERVKGLAAEDVDERVIPQIDKETLAVLFHSPNDALVAMMDDDRANMEACVLAKEEFGLETLVVRLRDVGLRDVFTQLGARVIDPASAMVHLLDQSISAPEAVDLLLQQDQNYKITQIIVNSDSIDGLALRDLRIPTDVLILEIVRDGQAIVPHGFSIIRQNDKLTLVGSPDSLAKLALRFA
jgi:Trk K+ transport system NAD-binding subunit